MVALRHQMSVFDWSEKNRLISVFRVKDSEHIAYSPPSFIAKENEVHHIHQLDNIVLVDKRSTCIVITVFKFLCEQ